MLSKKQYVELTSKIEDLNMEIRSLQRQVAHMSKWRLVENKCGRWQK